MDQSVVWHAVVSLACVGSRYENSTRHFLTKHSICFSSKSILIRTTIDDFTILAHWFLKHDTFEDSFDWDTNLQYEDFRVFRTQYEAYPDPNASPDVRTHETYPDPNASPGLSTEDEIVDFLCAHLYQLSQHSVGWDANYDTEDLVALAHWYLTNDTDEGDTFTWYTLLDVLAPACTLLVAGGSTPDAAIDLDVAVSTADAG
jgi:hypothetical protein